MLFQKDKKHHECMIEAFKRFWKTIICEPKKKNRFENQNDKIQNRGPQTVSKHILILAFRKLES